MSPKKFRVAGMGDLVTDLMVSIERFPVDPVGYQMIDRLDMQPGGMGNFLIAGQRLGMDMLPIDLMGNDQYGRATLEAFKSEGMDVSSVHEVEGAASRVVLVLADPGGQHAFLAYRKGDLPVQPLLPEWQKTLNTADALLVVGYSLTESYICQAILAAMDLVKENGGSVFFDPGPMIPEIPSEALRHALSASQVLLATEDELAALSGAGDLESARKLLRQGHQMVCIKQGASGCRIISAGQDVSCAGYPAQVRDTSGAGDSFAAAFIFGYLSQWPLAEIGAFANAMGAAKVQKFGAGQNVPTLDEIQDVLRANRVHLPHFPG
jgi:sugar/nucleoside kinase (ribokinase family)